MRPRPRPGMTLLEVIVALTVAGAALAAGAAVLGFLTDQDNRTGAQNIVAASAVRSTLREWAVGARLSAEGDAEFRGTTTAHVFGAETQEPVEERRDDEITFVTRARTEVAPAGTRVRIHMSRGDTVPMRGLIADLTPWRGNGAPLTLSLAPEATGFQARYLSSVFGRPLWQNSWISTSVLPSAVELRVLFDSAGGNASAERAARALLSVPMIVALAGRR